MRTILYTFLPEIFAVSSLIYLLVIGLLLSPYWAFRTFSNFMYQQLLTILVLILFAVICSEGHWHLILGPQIPAENFYPVAYLTTSFLIFLSKVTLILLTMASVLLHKPQANLQGRLALEYSIFIILITLACLILMSATNLGFAFVILELQTLALFVFSFFGHARKSLAAEAVFRYFVNGAFSSACLLFSLSLIYSLTGTLNLDSLSSLVETKTHLSTTSLSVLWSFATVLLFFAFFFKLTLAPFHHWIGDLYQGTSGYVGSYFTLVTKLPMWLLLIKTLPLFSNLALLWVFQAIALLSIALGAVYAFSEENFRRFWAISSVGHMGQVLLALTIVGGDNTFVAGLYLFFYLSSNIFVWALLLQRDVLATSTTTEVFSSIFRLLSLSHSRLSFGLLWIIVSLAGIPPAFGFVAKFYLYLSLYQSFNYFILALVFFLNLVSLAYYLRLLRLIYFKCFLHPTISVEERPISLRDPWILWGLTLLFLLHCFFGFWLLHILIQALLTLL